MNAFDASPTARVVACLPGDRRDRVSLGEMCVHLAQGTARDEARLRRAFGMGDRWLEQPPSRWPPPPLKQKGSPNLVNERLAPLADGREARAELERCIRTGVRVLPMRSPRYPPDLRELERPPILLTIRGRWPLPELEDTLAIVGARAATSYGRGATRRLSAEATRAGLAVVSGLARGIDRFALEAALDEGGWPVAVLGNGLDICYPPENARLQRAIAERGTLISEFALGQRPSQQAFPRRNRIIAALARAVLVVEAGQRSGALITVDYAQKLQRDVLAVPGPIDVPASRGTNWLIASGAAPILDSEGLLEHLGRRRERDRIPVRPAAERHPLLALLGRRALTPDELALEGRLALPAVRSDLVALELEGRVERWPGGRYALARRAAR